MPSPMTHRCITIAVAGALLYSAPPAWSKSMSLPADTVLLTESPLPGYQKALANCSACHSAEYMVYQPPSAARPYWDAMVKRMKQVFKAPIDDADMPQIVDYLVKTYGNEKAR